MSVSYLLSGAALSQACCHSTIQKRPGQCDIYANPLSSSLSPTTNPSLVPPLFPLSPKIANLPGVSQPSHKLRDLPFTSWASASFPFQKAFFKSSTKSILLSYSSIELRVQCRRAEVSQGSVLFGLFGLPLSLKCA